MADIITQVLDLHDRWRMMTRRSKETGRDIDPVWFGMAGREHFVRWSLANGYSKELRLDRENNNLGYSPDNCQWVTNKENVGKEHRKHKVGDRFYNVKELYEHKLCHGSITYPALKARLHAGWDLDRALRLPSNHGNKHRE